MKLFFDTSVLVASFWGDHPHHSVSLKSFAAATPTTGACAAHSLSEVYAVLTRLPVRPIVTPSTALIFIEEIQKRLTPVALSADDHNETLLRAAQMNLTGGQIYDALILKAAERVKAKSILTWNIGHFRRISPLLSNRIQTP